MRNLLKRTVNTIIGVLLIAVSILAGPVSPAYANGPEPENPGGPQVEGIPSGFFLIKSANGVQLYQKNYTNGQPDFVQVISLAQGAAIKLLDGGIVNQGLGEGPFGGNNPTFNRQSLWTTWNNFLASNGRAFCVSNGGFFSVQDPAPLAFSLKKDGVLTSDGYGSATEYPGQVLMLELWANRANIRALNKTNLYGSTAPNILGGLAEGADKNKDAYVGRTFAGIDDTNGDGIYETVYLFNTLYSRQIDAANVLRNFGADKIIMFDGGSSSQLICQGTSLVPSSQIVPQTIGVIRAGGPACPVITAWKGEYWKNQTLTGFPVICRNDSGVAFNWGMGSPAAGLPVDHFSARWSATLPFTSGRYRFHLKADDGVVLTVDGVKIINEWHDQGATEHIAELTLSGGQHSIKVDYYENTGEASISLWWEDLSVVVFSNKPAFDTCYLPNVSKMRTWWAYSPYYEANIYMGGSNRGCKAWNQQYLTASWVSQVRAQGWNLIPTWVGPQASCSTGNFYKMSSDPAVAYQQGRAEADMASLAAKNLGLTSSASLSGTIIYYDMESYPSGCRTVVKKFLSGWVDRLRELGNRSGVYGSGCSTYLTDLASGPSVPDSIWAAHWIYSKYTSTASTFGVACLSDSLWTYNRLRQYTGGHTETWGGVSLNIDSDIANGFVAGRTPRGSASVTDGYLQDMQAVSEDMSLLVYNDRLVRANSDFGGRIEITPELNGQSLRSAYFLDKNNGWALLASKPNARNFSTFSLLKTNDQGRTWSAQKLDYRPLDGNSTQGGAQIFFLTSKIGWISIQKASSSSFDGAAILHTTDGGLSWETYSAPTSGRLLFSTASRGVMQSPATGLLYTTLNAGKTWKAVQSTQSGQFQPMLVMSTKSPFMLSTVLNGSSLLAAREGGTASILLPEGVTEGQFINWNKGWVHVANGNCQGDKSSSMEDALTCELQEVFQWTADGGRTWKIVQP